MHALLEPTRSLSTSSETTKTSVPNLRAAIIKALADEGECWLETLLAVCSDYTWNQVFMEVDRMSRTGQLALTCHGYGEYRVRLPPHPA